MSENSDEMADDSSQNGPEDYDDNTLRILLSTDNHLGYCEKDSVRGMDSFAAFEEVLRIAKWKKVDFVLLSGDLFHENKPSRLTMHRTMEILRRYCMGPDAVEYRLSVRFQIVSNQEENFRCATSKCVNFEDEFYSVDLPVFSIHGNHDDPTRESGSTETLAALDLLAVSNLVNYFGRQDEVNSITIAPVLIKKGTTKVALFGLGSLRDERLNRMWTEKKVRFMRPQVPSARDQRQKRGCVSDEESDEESDLWFNIFTLHQNRDLGRGSKNCIHESMIPDWMDFVVWGHEHECLIEPMESLVGTYRIIQPGSSVATSLTSGESARKKVGLLEVRGGQFRLNSIPLSQVRGFAIKEVSLRDIAQGKLDLDDPKIDERISEMLRLHVNELIKEARDKFEEQLQDSETLQMPSSQEFRKLPAQKYTISQPQMVLIRLKVEHSGFTSLNNQRFGAQFVSEVANPSDILLFHRKRQPETAKVGSKCNAKTKKVSLLSQPEAPDEINEISVEELAKELLSAADHKLEILEEHLISLSIEDFVEKENRSAILDTVDTTVKRQQKILFKRGKGNDVVAGENAKVTTEAGVRELCSAEAEKARARAALEDETLRTKKHKIFLARVESEAEEGELPTFQNSVANHFSDEEDTAPISKDKSASSRHTSALSSARRAPPAAYNKNKSTIDDDLDSNNDSVEVAKQSRPNRAAAARGRAKNRYMDEEEEEEEEEVEELDDLSAEEIALDSSSEGDLSDELPKKRKGASRKPVAGRAAPKTKALQKAKPAPKAKARTVKGIASFMTAKTSENKERPKRSSSYRENDESDDDRRDKVAIDLAAGWGTSQPKRSRK